jgi:D-alanyl-D-alanine carboxypeptidase
MRICRWISLLSTIVLVPLTVLACAGDRTEGERTPHAASTAVPTEEAFDEGLASQLQAALEAAVENPKTSFPGAILYVSSRDLGTWIGTAGLGEIETGTPMRPDDKFRAGSIAKTFVSVVTLQLVEEGLFSLDDPLPGVLPESIATKFPDSDKITVRMLLNHSSGIPDWISPAVIEEIGSDPTKVWDVNEFLALAAGQPPYFAPGAGYHYSNTDYNLLGLIVERATGRSWRDEVTERVIQPLHLENTLLPEVGEVSIPGNYAHGYAATADAVIDITAVDPSMAGAAGGGALVTTVSDLARFLEAVLSGELFQNAGTLDDMLAFIDAPDEGGQVGYGLGMQRYLLPGGTEVIGSLGMTAGYTAFVGYVPAQGVTIAAAMNCQDDPTPVLLPTIQILLAKLSG